MLTVELPWPDSSLSPNSRAKWKKIAAAKEARTWGSLAIRQNYIVVNGWFESDAKLTIGFIFHPPDHKHRDLDNLVAMCKNYVDGIMDSLHNNDRQIDTIDARLKDVTKGGAVTIWISESED